MNLHQKIGLFGGIIISLFILLFGNFDPNNPQVTKMAGVAALMAVWWITEAIPISATAFIPLVLFPILGILSGEEIASSYINSTIFLFLGGFLLAIAMETWGLHRRIALKIIILFGGGPNSIIIGFLSATAFISMWISNTAAAVMMLPIGMAIIYKMEDQFGTERTKNFSIALMLSIAYASSLGGIATLIGTPPNLSFIRIYKIIFPAAPDISFGNWMLLALPITAIMLLLTSFLLIKVHFKIDKDIVIDRNFILDEYKKLGKIGYEEKFVGIILLITAFLWIFRGDLNLGFIIIPGWENIFANPKFLNDGVTAIAMSLILFFIPSKKEKSKKRLLDAESFKKVPWGIIILFGGGFALAKGFTTTGLSEFIGAKFSGMSGLPSIIIVLAAACIVKFLTELTSNTATAEMVLPIMASVAVVIGVHPWMLMITATLTASMAFMLPAGTPPNTIVFASERLKISDMVKAGFALNIVSILLVTLMVYLLGSALFDLNVFPEWAIGK